MSQDFNQINDLDDLVFAAEDAAERVIFQHAYLISQEAKRETWARGLPVTVLEGAHIVEIYPDGSKKIVGASNTKRMPVTSRKFTLKR